MARLRVNRHTENLNNNINNIPNDTNDSNRYSSLWNSGFDATWEIDVFGGVSRNVEATNADIQAAVEDRRDVLVTLLAEVARDYADLRGASAI